MKRRWFKPPPPKSQVVVGLEIRATAAELAAMPAPQLQAFLTGLGRVIFAAPTDRSASPESTEEPGGEG